jgi:hypothetical protein
MGALVIRAPRLSHAARAAGLWLALLAFALKGFVPAGYMVSANAGAPMVVLCTAQGAMAVALDEDGAPPQKQQDQHCAFAMAAPAAQAPTHIALAAPRAFAIAFASTPSPESIHADHTGPPLPARGPPSFI